MGKKIWDVIIVGGGPAGLFTSLYLKEKQPKWKVLLLEREQGTENRQYGSILNLKALEEAPWLKKHLKELVDFSSSRIRFYSSQGEKYSEYREKKAIAHWVWHSHFDKKLMEIARKKGVEIQVGQFVVDVLADVEGVHLTTEEGKHFQGKVLIAADGREGMIGQMVGIYDSLTELAPLTLGHFILKGAFLKEAVPMISFGFLEMPGYAFCYPFSEAVQLGVVLPKEVEEEKKEQFLRAWYEFLISQKLFSSCGEEKGPFWESLPAGVALSLEKSYGKRTLVVGDAGGFVVQTTGEGLYPALLSSKVAAEVLEEAFLKDLDEVIPSYSNRWNLAFGPYLQNKIELSRNFDFLLQMIYTDAHICARYAKSFLQGEKIL